MEYTKVQYFLFRIGELFNGRMFIAIVGLVISVGLAIFFAYDYKNNGPVFSDEETSNENNIKNANKKHSKLIETFLAIAPIIVLLLILGIKTSFSRIPSPDSIIRSNKYENATTGRIIWIHYNTGEVGIKAKERKDNNPIVAKVNNPELDPNTPLILPYAGTNITNKEFISLQVGDKVNIKFKPYKWEYKNHNAFIADKNTADNLKLLNEAKINSEVFKVDN